MTPDVLVDVRQKVKEGFNAKSRRRSGQERLGAQSVNQRLGVLAHQRPSVFLYYSREPKVFHSSHCPTKNGRLSTTDETTESQNAATIERITSISMALCLQL